MRRLRRTAVLAITLTLGIIPPRASAQEPAPARPRDLPHWMEYKRFTRDGAEVLKDDAAGRMEWWRERMGGELGPDFSRRIVREAEAERQKHPTAFPGASFAAAAAGAWVNLGPTGADFEQNGITYFKVDSGRIRAILPHPTDANTVYALCTGGGLWKTTNFLSNPPTWAPLTDFIGSTMGGAASFGRDASTIYLGMGESFEIGVGGFVVRSTDGGASWSTAAFLGTSTRVWDLKVDTSVGGSAATDIVLAGTNVGLFRSTNGGASFTQDGTITNQRVVSLARTSAGWIAAGRDLTSGAGTFYLSTNKGASWSPVAGTPAGIGRTTFGIGQPGDSVVYAFAASTSESSQRDLYRSTDGGATWSPLNLGSKTPTNPNGDQADMNVMAGQAFFNHMVLVDPTDSARNTVYIGGQLSTAKSTDGGATWTIISNWLPGAAAGTASLPYVHADLHSAAFSTAAGSRLFFGGDGGLFTSSDGGSTWDDTKNKGIASHLIYALTVNPGTPGSALIGLQDNGTRIRSLSPTPNSTFNQIRGGDGFGVGWSQANQATVLATYVYNSIRRSVSNPPTDQGNFSTFTSGLPTPVGNVSGASSSYYFVTPIITPTAAADPTGTVFFTYGSGGSGNGSKRIYRSSASAWTTIGTAGSGGIAAGRSVRATPHGIGVHPTDLNRLVAAGNGGNVLITTNGGTSWTEVFLGSTPPDGQGIGWVGFNSNGTWANDNVLYMASEASTAGVTRVARSANGGSTWTKADIGLPDVPVTKLVADPADSTGNTVYAATWIGVYVTSTGGASWAPLGSGFPQVPASDIYLAPNGSYLRASTYGRGVWEISLTAAAGPTINTHPANQSVNAGQTATFTVSATTSGGPLSYQWKKGTTNVGTNSSSYTTPATVPADNGAQFTVAVTDSNGTTTSNPATLTVLTPTTVTSFTPLAGPPGASVTIAGSGFSGATTVRFNGTVATFTPGSDTSLTAVVPTGATSGPISVTGSGTGTSLASFTVKSRDFNGDGSTDILDLALFARAFGSTSSSSNWNAAADLNGDGSVDDSDLTLFLAGF